MEIKGRYRVDIKEDGEVVDTYYASNMIVNNGLQRVVDWMISDVYSASTRPPVREIDVSGGTASDDGSGTNPGNAFDGSESSYYWQTASSTAWDARWLQMEFASPVNISAIYLDWYEDDAAQANQYRFEYEESTNPGTWVEITDVRFNPPQDTGRSSCFTFLKKYPDFSSYNSVSKFRMNMRYTTGNDSVYIYEMKFFEPNWTPQPPAVMALGTGTSTPVASGVALDSEIIRKVISNAVQPSGLAPSGIYRSRQIMSLGFGEGNDTVFTEIAMFMDDDFDTVQSTVNATTMFSRALFDSPSGWSKTSSQTADIFYEVTVSDASP